MKKAMLGIATAITLANGVSAEQPVVVELFTSQGCSSCPPADAFLHELAKRPDVLAFALHVDYWDYIGWKDVFANPAFTERQRAYARANGRRMVYTPQLIVNGGADVVGSHKKDANKLIEKNRPNKSQIQIDLKRVGQKVQITAQAAEKVNQTLTVQLVQYTPSSEVTIERGENAGRTISYANVVRRWDVLGSWSTQDVLEMDANIEPSQNVALILQQGTDGPIIAAARLTN